MKGFLAVVFFGIPGLFMAGSASAAVYKCNAHGEIVYSAHPCGKDAVKLTLKDRSYTMPPTEVRSPEELSRVESPQSMHTSRSDKRACPIDSLSSTELRNMRVSGVIMVCEAAEDVRATWGKPDSIKRTVSSGHVRERWLYDGPRGKPARSVSLEDGKVTSFQG